MNTRIFEKVAARRSLIIFNGLTSLLFVISFEFKEFMEGFDPFFILRGSILVTAILTYLAVFRKRGLWRFVHRDFETMDEREKILAGNAVQKAYSLFAILILIILMVYALSEHSINMIVVSFLTYLAHIIPSAVLAWDDYKYETGESL